jgi:arginine decarboxylase
VRKSGRARSDELAPSSQSEERHVQRQQTPRIGHIVDRNCHKPHCYGMELADAQPFHVEAFPMTA